MRERMESDDREGKTRGGFCLDEFTGGEWYLVVCADERIKGEFVGFRYGDVERQRGGVLIKIRLQSRAIRFVFSRDVVRVVHFT